MQLGEVVANRFELERVAGSGGMGTVYRARDLGRGEPVALKLLRATSRDAVERFAREVRVLAALRHPGIVRYIADGRTSDGELWLAMEWLEGESLAHRLARTGLTTRESIELVRHVAEALGAAHDQGVVHRDVKPSNLFLPDGELDRVKVLDFGIARISQADRASTQTGAVIGTPGYMAPEQARGAKDVGARADVFALGCVLFECLTGRPVFFGDTIMAVLAKILLEDAPRLHERRPELPDELDALIATMLAKQAEDRPRDGAELAAALGRLGAIADDERPPPGVAPAALTATERRLLCVVLIEGPKRDTIVSTPGPATPTGEYDRDALLAMRDAASAHGAGLERLVDGSYVITLAGNASASDQATTAARCALALKTLAPDAPIALATGRGVMAGRWPVGEAIDRAARLLRAQTPDRVRIDDVTAGLLDTRFEVAGDDTGLYVVAERDVVESVRTLLGKPTPCVGRERELAMFAGLFEECVAEPIARAVLVTGPAGIGKSRVRFELLRRIKERGEPVEVWIGRGDPLRAGSPFGMIAPALRRAAGINDGEPVEIRRQKLRARVMRHATVDLARTTAFLGELVGVPFPDDDVELRSARQDPLLMSDQVRRAFEHLVALETSAQPLLIVLEDLHWGDLPTAKLIDSALRALPDRPWMVVALARPDVYELFPRLWADRGLQELRLDDLTKKGSEKLVRRVLGDRASDSLVARLVEQAGGNAFYLEELIRAVAEGKGDAMPETVLAVVQARLERLEVDARRVLRAASVYGQQFWGGGVTALLGGVARDTSARTWLDELIERELIARVPASRFPDEHEYLFRHALVREAAYAMLTDGDRRLGHQLAGAWLERAGEGESIVLAEHYDRGGDPERAVDWYRRAADSALAACDFRGAAARAERGVSCGATGELLGALRLAQAEAHKWCGEFAETARCGLAAMALLPSGGARWFAAAGEAAEACGKLDDVPALAAIGQALLAAELPKGAAALSPRVTAIAQAAFQLFPHGLYELAQHLLDRVERAAGELDDPAVSARIFQARSSRAMYAGDAGAYLESEQAAAASFERAGDLRYACMQRGHVGYACLEIGAFADAERWLRVALDDGARLGLQNVVATAKHNLGRALQLRGELEEAEAIESAAVDAFRAQGDRRLESAARLYLAVILAERGDLDRAERELRSALAMALPAMRPQVLANLARLLVARGRPREALAAAREAEGQLEALGGVEEGEALIRLMLAETLEVNGERERARVAARRARDRLLARAGKISDPEWRRSFLERVPENARTIALASGLDA